MKWNFSTSLTSIFVLRLSVQVFLVISVKCNEPTWKSLVVLGFFAWFWALTGFSRSVLSELRLGRQQNGKFIGFFALI